MALQHAPVRVVPRTALVSGLVLCAAVGPLAGTGQAAAPASLKPAVTATNWYWAERAPSAAGMTGPTLPDQSVTAANVPAGDLGVGYANAQAGPADKVAAVAFDLTSVPLGSTFTRFQVTVPVDAAATQVQTGQPDVSACENIDAFQAGPGGGPLTDAPPVSDPSCVKGVFDPAKGYVFDLTAMANDWSGGAPSDGISLRPTTPDSTTAPFSIALKGKGAITTLAETTPPPVAVDDGGLAPAPSPAPTSAPAAAALPASAPVASVALPVSAPVAQVALPQTAPSPAVAAPPAPPVRIRAAGFVPPHDGPTSAWWLALLAGAGLLGATAVVLADPMAPAPVDARRARFSGAVRAGRRSA
ncbi:MAG: hypothetical protein ACXVFV_02790 [Mycobacteriales bacterium]